ncbi:sporulation protein [Halobacillus amylolyticus]|uniref:Sporulation protein n=1 Tax=Halobacillus amylolyticus TaxID=2932259 RepID=A0ABY4HFH5_9BACI|nr:sporulation protein [Halobacillus amylolyticus]UOR13053.1 sporulation protein [Halobacillus amylolyticus]
MFKKLMARAGIGAAKVDTQLEKLEFQPGETVAGKVVVQGGEVEQEIEQITIFLMTEALREVDDKKVKETVKLEQYRVSGEFVIAAKETKEIPFSIDIPTHTPATLNRLPLWFETGLDIPMALDAEDRDYIKVSVHPHIDTVLQAVERELGFRLKKVEMEHSRRHGYVQEFEFLPGGEFRGYLDELELIFFLDHQGLRVLLQVDRKARGLGGLFAEALEMDETNIQLYFSKEDLQSGSATVARELGRTIREHAK